MTERFEQQIRFLVEIDRVKHVFRRVRLFDHSRYENDAEHSWHLAMMALVFSEYANTPGIDIAKVIKMVLIHDLVEIDTGDLFLFDENSLAHKAESEPIAAERIFGLLPKDLGDELLGLWKEFEERKTTEACFAAALDRLEPVMQNHRDEGHSWQKNKVPAQKVYAATGQIKEGSVALWSYAQQMLEQSIRQGWLAKSIDGPSGTWDAKE